MPASHSPREIGLASPLRLATDVGLEAARGSGNALDAAITAAAMLTVAYPHNCALGGDLLALVREPSGRHTFINASGRAGRNADVDILRARSADMPLNGPATITVPGLVSGWEALRARGASLAWAELLAPAISEAADGVKVSPGLAVTLASERDDICASSGLRQVFAPQGEVLSQGQTLVQSALAQTLKTLADSGPDVFYGGELGARLIAGLNVLDVPLELADLAAHEVTEQPPLSVCVDGWDVHAAAPNSQGFLLLRLLGMLDKADAGSALLHQRVPGPVLANAFLQTTKERVQLLADPASMTTDVAEMLTNSQLRSLLEQSAATHHRRSHGRSDHGDTRRPTGDTVAVVAADSDGRSVSLIQSLYYSFGSLVLEPSTGVVMHNRGASFSLDPSSPNVLAPGKRPAHTLLPVLAERAEERLVVGTMGGEAQPQILTQVISRLIGGQSPQEAVAAPRWTVGGWDADEPTELLNFEADVDDATQAELRTWPGPIKQLPKLSGQVGHSHAIHVGEAGLSTGTDPRADGMG